MKQAHLHKTINATFQQQAHGRCPLKRSLLLLYHTRSRRFPKFSMSKPQFSFPTFWPLKYSFLFCLQNSLLYITQQVNVHELLANVNFSFIFFFGEEDCPWANICANLPLFCMWHAVTAWLEEQCEAHTQDLNEWTPCNWRGRLELNRYTTGPAPHDVNFNWQQMEKSIEKECIKGSYFSIWSMLIIYFYIQVSYFTCTAK